MLVARLARGTSAFSLALLVSAPALGAQAYWTCTSDMLFEGSQASDHMGWSIATNGNWNNDSYGTGEARHDILAGSFLPGNEVGVAELFISSGTDGFPINVACPFTGGRVRIEGEQLHDDFGHEVAFVGDIDNDGRDDIAIGMVSGPNFGAGLTERGAVYVFLSSDSNPNGIPTNAPASGVTVVDAADATLIIRGIADGSRLGKAIVGIGDWEGDGDGVPDFLIGAPGDDSWPATDPGHVYMVSGQKVKDAVRINMGTVDVDDVLVPAFLEYDAVGPGIIQGHAAGDRFGYSIVHLGEAGDTAHGSDFAIGAPQFDGQALIDLSDEANNTGTGYVRIWLGSGAHIIQRNGTQAKERFGFALGGKANVDNDANGRSDLIIGSPFWDEPGHTYDNAGKVTVLKSTSFSQIGSAIVGADATGPEPYWQERLGFAALGIADLSGGAGDEFIVGSYGHATAQLGPFSPSSSSPCAPCEKLTQDGTMGLALGGYVMGRAQVFTYDGSAYSVLEEYWGDHKDSAGTALGYLPNVGPNKVPGVVIGAFRWGDTWFPKPEVGRVHVFLW